MMEKVLKYWKEEYDWRAQEKVINQFPQYKTRIEGINVHFWRVKPQAPGQ